ncbi:MAG: DUF5615 family PIN-like protein [Planctomycetia bacterium]|nr:DUF5615 family PIN-like protein [Planctomycetia bacterium]
MAGFLADENVHPELMSELRLLGHDVIRVRDLDAGGADDPMVLQLAMERRRAVLTADVSDYRQLHRKTPWHYGIVTIKRIGPNYKQLAKRIDEQIKAAAGKLKGKLIHIPLLPDDPPEESESQ